jgi:hypothetical protein
MQLRIEIVPMGRIDDRGESTDYACRAFQTDGETGYVDSDSLVTAEFHSYNAQQQSPLAQAKQFEKDAPDLVAAKLAKTTKTKGK